MKALGAIIWFCAILTGILSLVGGLSAGIWLAMVGEWTALVAGIALLLAATWILGFAMMPASFFFIPAASFSEKGKWISLYLFAFMGTVYATAILSAWCLGVLYYFTIESPGESLLASLAWSFAVALVPIVITARKEARTNRNSLAAVLTMATGFGYLVAGLILYFQESSFSTACLIFEAVLWSILLLRFALSFYDHWRTAW